VRALEFEARSVKAHEQGGITFDDTTLGKDFSHRII